MICKENSRNRAGVKKGKVFRERNAELEKCRAEAHYLLFRGRRSTTSWSVAGCEATIDAGGPSLVVRNFRTVAIVPWKIKRRRFPKEIQRCLKFNWFARSPITFFTLSVFIIGALN